MACELDGSFATFATRCRATATTASHSACFAKYGYDAVPAGDGATISARMYAASRAASADAAVSAVAVRSATLDSDAVE